MFSDKTYQHLSSSEFDFIFLGAGCASLSVVMRMIKSGRFADKKILLVDKLYKNQNDRTWCFWEKDRGFFEDIVYKKWGRLSFLSDDYSSRMEISPYQYKMIRGIDFYQYCFNEIEKQTNIEVVYVEVKDWQYHKEGVRLDIDDGSIHLSNGIIFNSIYKPGEPGKKTIRLLQHFKGWIIETPEPVFEEEEATIMDFRVKQDHGTTFGYVLPLNSNTALIEYTLFSRELLETGVYDQELTNYIHSVLGIKNYVVSEEEFGVIPMSNEKFLFSGKGWNIGTAGGQTKASSGYTFQFIQKQSQQILDCLLAGKTLYHVEVTPRRFRFYDNTLLNILYHQRIQGKHIFTTLFKKNKPEQILRFLDNESSVFEELKIIASLPLGPFLKSALQQL